MIKGRLISTSWWLLSRRCTGVYHVPCTRFVCYEAEIAQFESQCVNNFIKRIQILKSAEFLSSCAYQQCIQDYKDALAPAPPIDRGNKHVKATPLLDVLYVSVQSNKSDAFDRERPPFKVYGIIQLIDDQNHKYDVYSRDSDNPETVSPGCNLSLFHPDGTPSSMFLPCVSALKMRVHLRDAATDGKVIAKGDFDVQLMNKVWYLENIKTEVVDGNVGFASIQYATLPYAVIAYVELRLEKKDETDSSQSHGRIYGNIYASSKVKEGSISSVLFNRPSGEPMMVDFAKPIRLSRNVVAVPAYSPIQIKINLWDHLSDQQIASDVVANFEAGHNYCPAPQNLVLGQNYHIQVKVRLNHIYYYIFTDAGWAYDDQKLVCGQLPSLVIRNRATNAIVQLPKPYTLGVYGFILVEVFSISITPHDNVTSRLCGTIKVYDAENYGKNSYYIFNRSISNPEILDGDKKIKSIKWPSNPIPGVCFGMDLHLTDDLGHEVCKGYLDCDVQQFSTPRSWYGKRVSSVIKGQHGYATVNYAIFYRALKAKVRVVFIPNRSCDVRFKISGEIVARCSAFDYSSYSEKMFFQSTLFEDNHHVIPAGNSQLMLQKPEVPVPIGSLLTVDVKLQAQAIGESSLQHLGTLSDVLDFGFDEETFFKRIKGENFHVDVLVEWTSRELAF